MITLVMGGLDLVGQPCVCCSRFPVASDLDIIVHRDKCIRTSTAVKYCTTAERASFLSIRAVSSATQQ